VGYEEFPADADAKPPGGHGALREAFIFWSKSKGYECFPEGTGLNDLKKGGEIDDENLIRWIILLSVCWSPFLPRLKILGYFMMTSIPNFGYRELEHKSTN